MRYNVHSPCAFRNRIAKSLGVLVGAALVATLGLPRAAQAQVSVTAPAPDVTFEMNEGFQVMAPDAVSTYATRYRIIYSKDGGAAKMLPAADEVPTEAGQDVGDGTDAERTMAPGPSSCATT